MAFESTETCFGERLEQSFLVLLRSRMTYSVNNKGHIHSRAELRHDWVNEAQLPTLAILRQSVFRVVYEVVEVLRLLIS